MRKRPDVPDIPKDRQDVTKKIKSEILEESEKIEVAYRKQSEKDFMCFARGLVIAAASGPKVFERCMAPFQRECFESLAPNLDKLRNGEMPKRKRYWIERTKKGSKDADLGLIMCWLIAFPRRPFYIQVGAANRTQSAIVKERIVHLLYNNPWLNDYIEVIQWQVRSRLKMISGLPMASLDIMSSDISGAHGGTPDLLVINELSHVQKWEFVENLMDNADGVPQGMVIIATNAGFKGTKAEIWRNNSVKSFDWQVHVLDRPAPWHSKEMLVDAKNRNSPSRYSRLWNGIWASGKGDALLEEDIEKCFNLEGPCLEKEFGWDYIAGLDIGISHDRSGLVVLGVNMVEQRIKTVWWKTWAPLTRTGEVDLKDVEDECRKVHSTYNISGLWYDPTEARLMAQRLKVTIPMRKMVFTPGNLSSMAESLIQVMSSGKLSCYDDFEGTLRRDFGKFNIVEKPYGYRLEAVSDEFGHADVGTALVIALPAAIQMMEGSYGLRPGDDLVDTSEGDLTEEEIEDLPEEFRELFDLSAEQEELSKLDKFDGFLDDLL